MNLAKNDVASSVSNSVSTLSLNDLIVYGGTLQDDTLMTSEIITKYAAIFTDTNELITAPYWLKQAGERSIRISLTNDSPTTLVLCVLPPNEFEQEIILTPPQSFLNEAGKYSFLATYRGFEATFTKDFTILVTKPNPSSPFTYRFDNLNYTEDTSKISVTFTNEKTKLEASDKGYHSPDELTLGATIADDASGTQSRHLTQAKGKVLLSVVPVILPGDETN